jgi:sugar phosphate isomerase/epimerase
LKIGLSTWSLLGLDVVSAVRRIGDAGFDYIELWGDVPHAFPGWVDPGLLRDALSCYNMTLTAHTPFAELNPATQFEPLRGAVTKTLDAFISFAASVGASVVTVHPGSAHSKALVSGSYESSVSTIRGMLKAADGRLAISVENQTSSVSNYHYPILCTPESGSGYLDSVEGLRFTLDTGHAHASGQDPSVFAAKAASRLVEVHLSDNRGSADEHLIPGEGTADLVPLVRKVAGTDVLLCLELDPYRYTPDRIMQASTAFKSSV